MPTENSRIPVFWLLAFGVLVSDQISKFMVTRALVLGETMPIFEGYFHFTHVRNTGGAFGLVPGAQKFFLAASVLVTIGVIIYKLSQKPGGSLVNMALGLILGGAAGNLVDRLNGGEVIDWIDFQIWPVFNIADMALISGLALLSLYIIRSN